MAQGRKYATLPDLDSAPDIYETSEGAGNNSEAVAPPSPASTATTASFQDATSLSNSDEDNDANGTSRPSRIDRHSNRPARARDAFSGSRVDARGVDFSDRITDGRRSYRVTLNRKSRRRRREREGGGYVDEYGDFSDEDEEEESFAEKLARLKREVEEMRIEGDRIAKGGDENVANGKRKEYEEAQDGIAELGKILDALQTNTRSSRLAKTAISVHASRQHDVDDEKTTATPSSPEAAKSTQSEPQLPSSEEIDRILSKAAEFESRLTLLETSLGGSIQGAIVGSQISQSGNKNVLTTLSTLESQVSALSNTTLPSIDSMDRQIRQLAEDAARLEDARIAARTAQESLAAKSPSTTFHGGTSNGVGASPTSPEFSSPPEDAEQAARISALYSTLPTIEAMAPLVPSVLERLKSLRVLHADAASARENLAELEKTQARMEDEIRGWREGLEKAETAFKTSDETGIRNSNAMEEWVKNLERRLDTFGA